MAGRGKGVYCHCYPVFGCEPATSEVYGPDVWRPVCERCMQIAFEKGLRVRKLQRQDGQQRGMTSNDPLNPAGYDLETAPVAHALAWTLDSYKRALRGESYKRALRGEPTPGADVISFAESVLTALKEPLVKRTRR